jgi:hypothetical protein
MKDTADCRKITYAPDEAAIDKSLPIKIAGRTPSPTVW